MTNKFDISMCDIDSAFMAVKSGEMTIEQFHDWVQECKDDSYAAGQDNMEECRSYYS
jgi:hypothetical protein